MIVEMREMKRMTQKLDLNLATALVKQPGFIQH